MTTGRHGQEYQHISSGGVMALDELFKGLDHNSAPWPTAPWCVFRADNRCCLGRVVLQLYCLSLRRAFLDNLYFTSVSAAGRSHGWDGAGGVTVVLLGHLVPLCWWALRSCTALALIWELMVAGVNGPKTLPIHSRTSLSSVNLLELVT